MTSETQVSDNGTQRKVFDSYVPDTKLGYLIGRGMKITGVVLEKEGSRAFVDDFGRVVWTHKEVEAKLNRDGSILR